MGTDSPFVARHRTVCAAPDCGFDLWAFLALAVACNADGGQRTTAHTSRASVGVVKAHVLDSKNERVPAHASTRPKVPAATSGVTRARSLRDPLAIGHGSGRLTRLRLWQPHRTANDRDQAQPDFSRNALGFASCEARHAGLREPDLPAKLSSCEARREGSLGKR